MVKRVYLPSPPPFQPLSLPDVTSQPCHCKFRPPHGGSVHGSSRTWQLSRFISFGPCARLVSRMRIPVILICLSGTAAQWRYLSFTPRVGGQPSRRQAEQLLASIIYRRTSHINEPSILQQKKKRNKNRKAPSPRGRMDNSQETKTPFRLIDSFASVNYRYEIFRRYRSR